MTTDAIASLIKACEELYTENQLPERMLWIGLLPPARQREFYGQMYQAKQSQEPDRSSRVETTALIWRATAEIYGNPELSQRLGLVRREE